MGGGRYCSEILFVVCHRGAKERECTQASGHQCFTYITPRLQKSRQQVWNGGCFEIFIKLFFFSSHHTTIRERKNWKKVDQGWNKTNCPSCLQWYPVYLIENWRLHHFQSKEKQSGFPSRMWTQCGLHVLRIVSGRSQLLSHIQRRRRQTRKGSWRKWKSELHNVNVFTQTQIWVKNLPQKRVNRD